VAEFARVDALAAGSLVATTVDQALKELAATAPRVVGLSGRGCFRGIRLAHEDGGDYSSSEVLATVAQIRHAGVIVHPGPSCVQLVPALTYPEPDLHLMLERVATVLAAA
jgi:acetylornithine/succinyldiaminopimelate/putrescine aminotransferase